MKDTTNDRQWFQLRLSTLFVLVTILGWMLATRPYVLADRQGTYAGSQTDPWGQPIYHVTPGGINPRLLWPALALATFVSWKTGSTARRTFRGSARV